MSKATTRTRPINFEPSPEEIASECKAIRETWTDTERRQRWNGPTVERWSVPRARRAELRNGSTGDE